MSSNKKMLIDATHPEETRVVVLDGNHLENFDVEVASRRQLKGNIYLAKVIRVEPSLQAAFVDYGGNRHGFLAFSEIHPDYYQIPVADREALAAAHARESISEEADAFDDEENAVESENGETSSEETSEEQPETVEAAADADGHEAGDDSEAQTDDNATNTEDENAVGENTDNGDQDNNENNSQENGEDDIESVALEENGDVSDADDEAVTQPEDIGGDDAEELGSRRKSSPQARQYKIQEVIKRRQVLLVQVVKEERGNKGAALTTYLSLAGRYCVLMPNTARGGGISRKITNGADRKKLKSILAELDIPEGMAIILRTAGINRSKTEIKRDYDYLIRLWTKIRDLTLESTAPATVHEEGDLIKRSIRDLYSRDVDEIIVEGEAGYKAAKECMKMQMPSHARKVKQYNNSDVALFRASNVEDQLNAMHNPVVQLRSGGYIVINPTEALVSIDVNSGRSTKERNIEETALKTNIEAADEVARQLRLRDLAGLVVIDFIDMDINRNNIQVERRLKEAMKNDRARIQVGRISAFGLLELSRQRLRPSLIETSSETCPYCEGTGVRRSTDSTALSVMRTIEEECTHRRASEITVHVPNAVALYILNNKRDAIAALEERYALRILFTNDDTLIPPALRIERTRSLAGDVISEMVPMNVTPARPAADATEEGPKKKRRRRRKKKDDMDDTSSEDLDAQSADSDEDESAEETEDAVAGTEASSDEEGPKKKRRRGRRGGRKRRRNAAPSDEQAQDAETDEGADTSTDSEQSAAGDTDADTDSDSDSNDGDSEAEAKPAKPARKRPARKRRTKTASPSADADKTKEDTPAETASDSDSATDNTAPIAAIAAAVETVIVNSQEESTAPKRKGWWNRLSD